MRITIPIPSLSYYKDTMQTYWFVSYYYFRFEIWYAPSVKKQLFYRNKYKSIHHK